MWTRNESDVVCGGALAGAGGGGTVTWYEGHYHYH